MDWGDKSTPWDLLFSVFKWADAAQAAWYQAPGMPAAVTDLANTWQGHSVTRANTVRLHARFADWPDKIEIEPWCCRVGRTSWDMNQRFTNAVPGQPEQQLASVVTTMVAVDESLVNTVPIENRDAIAALVQPPTCPFDDGLKGVQTPPPAATIYSGQGTVRLVDSDSLGHVNNAKYVYLACEALHEAVLDRSVFGASVTSTAELLDTVDTIYASYTGQMVPGERYSFVVFEAVPSAVFQCSFKCRGEPMCTLAFGRGAATKQASL